MKDLGMRTFRARWAVVALGCALVGAAATSAHAQGCGDLNGDGVDVIDAANVLRAAVDLPSSCDSQEDFCDVDGDGNVTVIDSASVLRRAVNLPGANDCPGTGEPTVTPTPGPGDPTSTPTPVPQTVTFNVSASSQRDGVKLQVTYPTAKGNFRGSADQVACVSNAAGAQFARNDQNNGTLILVVARSVNLTFPFTITCTFDPSTPITGNDLAVAVTEASAGGNNAAVNVVQVAIDVS